MSLGRAERGPGLFSPLSRCSTWDASMWKGHHSFSVLRLAPKQGALGLGSCGWWESLCWEPALLGGRTLGWLTSVIFGQPSGREIMFWWELCSLKHLLLRGFGLLETKSVFEFACNTGILGKHPLCLCCLCRSSFLLCFTWVIQGLSLYWGFSFWCSSVKGHA